MLIILLAPVTGSCRSSSLTGVKSRLQDSNTVVLWASRRQHGVHISTRDKPLVVSLDHGGSVARTPAWASYLQHMQQCRLSGIVESEEQELGVLVQQPQR